jgi:methionyl-tRNA formyltransferase
MQMDEGLDTGPILMSETCPVNPNETTATLHDKLADLGAKLLIESLNQLQQLCAVAQPEQGVCYAHKIEKAETWINWHQSAQTIERKSRAFTPTPGLQTHFNDETIKIWVVQALSNGGTPLASSSAPGCVVGVGSEGIDVQTVDGVIRILELQRAGGKRMSCAAFIQGAGALKLGARFGSGPPASMLASGS